jgi:hypothetical protein
MMRVGITHRRRHGKRNHHRLPEIWRRNRDSLTATKSGGGPFQRTAWLSDLGLMEVEAKITG